MPALSCRLWEAALPEALDALYHPFVCNLYSGSLPKCALCPQAARSCATLLFWPTSLLGTFSAH